MAKSATNGLKRYLIGVAVTITVVLLTQTGVLIWWCATIQTRMDYIEQAVDRCCVAMTQK